MGAGHIGAALGVQERAGARPAGLAVGKRAARPAEAPRTLLCRVPPGAQLQQPPLCAQSAEPPGAPQGRVPRARCTGPGPAPRSRAALTSPGEAASAVSLHLRARGAAPQEGEKASSLGNPGFLKTFVRRTHESGPRSGATLWRFASESGAKGFGAESGTRMAVGKWPLVEDGALWLTCKGT